MHACTAGGKTFIRLAIYLLWGLLMRHISSAGGSGSGYITGFCDKYWRPGMSAEQAEDFVRRAVGHALARDGSSGGCIRTVTISKAGVKRTFTPNDEVSALCGAALLDFPDTHCVRPNVPRARLAKLRPSFLSCSARREHPELALHGQDSVYANEQECSGLWVGSLKHTLQSHSPSVLQLQKPRMKDSKYGSSGLVISTVWHSQIPPMFGAVGYQAKQAAPTPGLTSTIYG